MTKHMSRKLMIGGLGLVVTAVGLSAYSGCGQKPQTPAPPAASLAQIPAVIVTTVESRELNRQVRLPGELQAYQDTALYAKVPGFVEVINVDRGSEVKQGQLLARLRAPELDTQRGEAAARVRATQSQRVEAQAKIGSIRAQRLEAEAKLAADEATYQRMKAASATPGVVAGNDLEIAQRAVEAGRARVQLWHSNEAAAQAEVKTIEENERALRDAERSSQNIEDYLRITAPFDGVITERNVHQGSLASPVSSQTNPPMLRLQQVSRLRLVVPVPEANISGITPGAKISFTVPSFPGETFSGIVQRISHALDPKTRTMPVELDVSNANRRLAPGMLPEVIWPVSRPNPSMFVPPSAIATTTERSFVIRIRDGVTEWVDVKRGASMSDNGKDLVEVFGDLRPGDQIAVRGTDELRAGIKVNVKQTQGGKQ
jgi:membrane fusion protein (multidrug efflux system)